MLSSGEVLLPKADCPIQTQCASFWNDDKALCLAGHCDFYHNAREARGRRNRHERTKHAMLCSTMLYVLCSTCDSATFNALRRDWATQARRPRAGSGRLKASSCRMGPPGRTAPGGGRRSRPRALRAPGRPPGRAGPETRGVPGGGPGGPRRACRQVRMANRSTLGRAGPPARRPRLCRCARSCLHGGSGMGAAHTVTHTRLPMA